MTATTVSTNPSRFGVASVAATKKWTSARRTTFTGRDAAVVPPFQNKPPVVDPGQMGRWRAEPGAHAASPTGIKPMKVPDVWLVSAQESSARNSDPTLVNDANNGKSNVAAADRPQAQAVSTLETIAATRDRSRASLKAAPCVQMLKMPLTAARLRHAPQRWIPPRPVQGPVPVQAMDQGVHAPLHAVPDHGITAPVSTTEADHPPAAD